MLEKGKVVFGNWTVEEEIGSGAFGTVYKIKREEFGKIFYAAMKVLEIPQDKEEHNRLRREGMDDASISNYYAQIAQDFIKEIELLSSLDGITNIVDYKDHIIEPNNDLGYTIYIKMQLLNPIANTLLNSDGSVRFMGAEDVIKLGKDMCSALEVCERKKIIHRDIKIDNIFVSENGDYKLGDFGIAKQLEATQGEMSKKGTVLYMAPEVFRGENYDKTVDIYSLGVVLYRLLNKNRAPFFPNYPDPIRFSDKETANAKRLKGEVFPDIAGISAELNAVLKKACAFKPSDRYQSASELKAALESVEVIPVAPVVVAPVVENTVEDEKTESAFDVASTIATPVMDNSVDEEATGATVGVFSAIPVTEPVISDSFCEKETVTLASVDDEKTESVFDVAPVTPIAVAPVVNNNTDDEKTESVFTPAFAPDAGVQPLMPSVSGGASSNEKKSKKSIIIIIAIILVLGIGVAAFIWLGRNSGYNSDNYYSDNGTTTEAAQSTDDDDATTSITDSTISAPPATGGSPQGETNSATVGYVPTSSYYEDDNYDDSYYEDDNYDDNYYEDDYYEDDTEDRIYYYKLNDKYWYDVSCVEDYCYVDFEYVYVYGEEDTVWDVESYDWKYDEYDDAYVVPGDSLTVYISKDPDHELYRVYDVYHQQYGYYEGKYDEDEIIDWFGLSYGELLEYGPNETIYVYDEYGYCYELTFTCYYDDYGNVYNFYDVNYY